MKGGINSGHLNKNIYLIPGLGADERVFQNLILPSDPVKIVRWIKPIAKETLKEYSIRLSTQIVGPSPILIGVSFGGMVAVELNKILKINKVILISSAKNTSALPSILKGTGKIRLIKLIPTMFFNWSNWLVYYLFDAQSTSDKRLLKDIVQDSNPYFVKWALTAMAGWDYRGSSSNVISIHGKKDKLIPFTSAEYTIDSGGHFMIVNESEDISRIISDLC